MTIKMTIRMTIRMFRMIISLMDTKWMLYLEVPVDDGGLTVMQPRHSLTRVAEDAEDQSEVSIEVT